MPTVVREINQEYEGKLDEIKNGTAHDTLEMSGSRAVWPEVLAIYAVKTSGRSFLPPLRWPGPFSVPPLPYGLRS